MVYETQVLREKLCTVLLGQNMNPWKMSKLERIFDKIGFDKIDENTIVFINNTIPRLRMSSSKICCSFFWKIKINSLSNRCRWKNCDILKKIRSRMWEKRKSGLRAEKNTSSVQKKTAMLRLNNCVRNI